MLGIAADYRKHMQVRTSRLRKWVPMLLTVVGSVALAAGVFVAVITVTRTPANHRGIGLPMHGAVYVGADTCFTCHLDQNPDWSMLLRSEPVTSPAANTQTALVDVPRAQTPRVGGASIASVDVIGGSTDAVSQHYVIATENDPALLPGPAHPVVPLSEGSARCTDCHADEQAAATLHLEHAQDACAVCHPTMSGVRRAGLPVRVQHG